MTELWVDVCGYEGLYQVSNLGNIRSCNYRNTGKVKNLYLKPHTRGYLQVELRKTGARKMFLVHRLVGKAFVPGYQKGLTINHLDKNKRNNNANNLEWCKISDNIAYSLNTDKQKVWQLDWEGNLLQEWDSSIAIKRSLGFSDWSIKQCCRGNRKSAYGFKWQYAI